MGIDNLITRLQNIMRQDAGVDGIYETTDFKGGSIM